MLVQKSGAAKGKLSNTGLYIVLVLLAVLATGTVTGWYGIPRLVGKLSEGTAANQVKTIQNSQYGYAISIPGNWRVADNFGGTFSATSPFKGEVLVGGITREGNELSREISPMPSNGFSKVDVIAYELEYEISPRDLYLAKTIAGSTGVQREISVAGKSALLVETSTADALHETANVKYMNVFVTNGKYGYLIAGFAESATFESILNSFQFVK
jgi:hypothetical protein